MLGRDTFMRICVLMHKCKRAFMHLFSSGIVIGASESDACADGSAWASIGSRNLYIISDCLLSHERVQRLPAATFA